MTSNQDSKNKLLRLTPSACLTFRSTEPTELSKDPQQAPLPTVDLHVANVSDSFVLFKFKTTSRDGYFVRPAMGLIPKGESTTINVELQPDKTEPNKDKFLIQSYPIPNIDSFSTLSKGDFHQAWKAIEEDAEKKAQVVYQKLKCSHEPASSPSFHTIPPYTKPPRPSPLQTEQSTSDNDEQVAHSARSQIEEAVDEGSQSIVGDGEDERSRLQLEIDDLRAKIIEVEHVRDEFSKKVADLTDYNDQLQKSKNEQSILLESKKEEVKDLEDRISRLETQFDELVAKKSEIDTSLAARTSEIGDLNRELEEKNKRLELIAENRARQASSSSLAVKLAVFFAILAFVMYLKGRH
ncbi:hypothetical protein P9112_003046 [Eukaryota sp. TZLM1-RC]